MSSAPRPGHAPFRAQAARTEPFRTADEAWFWTMAALIARREGARILAGQGLVSRPCEPDDVVKCLDRLYRQRRIDLAHARILRIWGERGEAPDPRHLGERGDWRLWREAMVRLEWPLRVKGIVADPAGPASPGQTPRSTAPAAQGQMPRSPAPAVLGQMPRSPAPAVLGQMPRSPAPAARSQLPRPSAPSPAAGGGGAAILRFPGPRG